MNNYAQNWVRLGSLGSAASARASGTTASASDGASGTTASASDGAAGAAASSSGAYCSDTRERVGGSPVDRCPAPYG